MTLRERMAAEDARIAKADARRAAHRRATEALPICGMCGGRVKGGRCIGDGGMIRCGLHNRP